MSQCRADDIEEILTRFQCTLRRNKYINRRVRNRNTLAFEEFSLILYLVMKFAIVEKVSLLCESALRGLQIEWNLKFTKLARIYNLPQ